MKKIKISEKNMVTVYQFMEMCGLECSIKKNISVSHKIMLKKLSLRHDAFPTKVVVPKRISFKEVNKEDILRGNIVIVKDDYKNKTAYLNPNLFMARNEQILSKQERREIRKRILNEYLEEIEEEEKKINNYKPGYLKYLNKKNKRQEEEMKESLEAERDEEIEYILENASRVKKYPGHSFRRR